MSLDSALENLTSVFNNSNLLWNISTNYAKSYKYLNFETITTVLSSFITSSPTINILFNINNLNNSYENVEDSSNSDKCANYDSSFYENLNSVNLGFFFNHKIFITGNLQKTICT